MVVHPQVLRALHRPSLHHPSLQVGVQAGRKSWKMSRLDVLCEPVACGLCLEKMMRCARKLDARCYHCHSEYSTELAAAAGWTDY
jgi:hypothetical protein